MLVILGLMRSSIFLDSLEEHIICKVNNFFLKTTSLLLDKFVNPKSKDEDIRGREFILNILLVSCTILFIFICSLSAYQFFILENYRGFLPIGLFSILGFFISLIFISRTYSPKISAYLFLTSLMVLAIYSSSKWGVDLAASVLFYSLVIIMSGILIGTSFSFFVTLLAIFFITLINHLHLNEVIPVNRYWTEDLWTVTDIVSATVLFFIIVIVSWLSNREIERSLARARKSEADLKEERDMLEIRVKERTEELRRVEMAKLAQAYRFVEFGRFATGVFHDLTNPLTALSMNIESIANSKDVQKAKLLSADIERANNSAKHMKEILNSLRNHLSQDNEETKFLPVDVIKETISLLEGYAKTKQVNIYLSGDCNKSIYGKKVRFMQILTNLISNAIESYEGKNVENSRHKVFVEVSTQDDRILIGVTDKGKGIAPDLIKDIFEPFVTTKTKNGGLGIGLSLALRMVEQDFKGNLSVNSNLGEGSVFVLDLPVSED